MSMGQGLKWFGVWGFCPVDWGTPQPWQVSSFIHLEIQGTPSFRFYIDASISIKMMDYIIGHW